MTEIATKFSERTEYAAAKRALLLVCSFGQTTNNVIRVSGTFDEHIFFKEIQNFDHDKADTTEPLYSNMNNTILFNGHYVLDCDQQPEDGGGLVFTTENYKTVVYTKENGRHDAELNSDTLHHSITVYK